MPSVSSLPLLRHSRSGRYYGVKKIRGKRRECSLRTTDRKMAERRLREWMRNLDAVDREVEKTPLRGLLRKFVASNQGKSVKTQRTNASIIKQMELSWPGGLDAKVRNVRIALRRMVCTTREAAQEHYLQPLRWVGIRGCCQRL